MPVVPKEGKTTFACEKNIAYVFGAAAAALVSSTGLVMAGTLNVTSGPTFTPESFFTNNPIVIDTTTTGVALVEAYNLEASAAAARSKSLNR